MPPLSSRRGQAARPEDMGAGVTAGQVAAPVQPQQRQQGPGWVDFGRLLSANRAGAQRMADNLAAGVRKEGDAANAAIEQGQQAYTAALGQKTTQYSPDGANTPEDADAKAGGTFQGPKSWEDAGVDTVGIAGKAAAAQAKAGNLTSDYGRAALLRAQVQGPYSAGMAGMDAALAGGAGGAALRQTADSYANLSQRLIDARGGTDAAYKAAETADAEARGKYKARADELRAGIAAEQKAARGRQQEQEATDAAGGGTYRPGANRDAIEERRKGAPNRRVGGESWDTTRRPGLLGGYW